MSNIRLSRCLIVTVLMVMTGTSPALTIGRHQGVAALGRPLDLQVPVGLDSGMDPSDLCPEVEVSYGEIRLGPRLVDVQTSGSGESVRVRIRVAQVLDEPFAAVQLRIGCSQKLSRRFVLLAEAPAGEEPTVISASAAPVADEPALASPAPSAAALGAALPPISLEPSNAARPGTPALRPRTVRPEATQSRLQLDPLAIRSQGAASAGIPAVSVVSPISAASAPAPTPGGSSPAVIGQVQALEDEVRKLQEALVRSESAAAQLRTRVEERERFDNPLVYALALGCALLMALAGLAWRRARARRTAVWWRESAGAPSSVVGEVGASPSDGVVPLKVGGRGGGLLGRFSHAADPIDPSPLSSKGRAPDVAESIGTPVAHAAFDGDQPAPQALSSYELSDTQQEADFFVSLGEYDRAIDVLRNHVESHPQSSAMAWLDLLAIQHKLGRQQDYEEHRRDFERLFTARLPAFDDIDTVQRGLEDHPELLARIEALWPDTAVVDLIHDSLFRGHGDNDSGQLLGLQTFRDLLFLHQMAQEIAVLERGGHALAAGGTKGPTSGTQNSSIGADAPNLAFHAPDIPPVNPPAPRPYGTGGRLGLDIDLEEVLAQPSAAPDPRHARNVGSQQAAGLDELLNFELETDPDSVRTSGRRGGRGFP